ncbi:MAG: M20 family metallopeptidase [Acidimicrobiales bacterium]|nr:M20 family metallopeptidase [Acidimicrobiales bacterium]MBO0893417.1 M20 family metallopeptidase [Acidimicrobiales bacterium]
MVEQLAELVTSESPSADKGACLACARQVAELGTGLLGTPPELLSLDGRPHLRWVLGTRSPRVVLIGHLDTVWPLGTVERWPFTVTDGIATGPGTFDMKAGIVQVLHALSVIGDPDGVALLVTSDEELGSPTSRALVEETARGARAALVLEPAAGRAIKVARKGTSMYQLSVKGRAAHAGSPERGINATEELAHLILAVAAVGRPERGTTVTPTVVGAGTTTNTVPEQAELHVDVRAATREEQARVDADVRALSPVLRGAVVSVAGGPNRPPLPATASTELMERARRAAADLGLGALDGVTVGGASDGNFTAELGVPTLDGLGAVGANAHAERERIEVAAMAERAALVAALVEDLLSEIPPPARDRAG